MNCYKVTVEIKRGYVRPNGRVAVSMSLPEGAETIIDLTKVYISHPNDHSVVLLEPIDVSIETEEDVVVALFEAAALLDVATNNEITMVAGLTDVITPVGEEEEYDCLYGSAKFKKNIVGRRGGSSNRKER
ncbi:hypothetical protein DEAC_c36020 [Desulfosporosinus acididurans]|uniref:Uncharacterized protein n=1 Tax=Desulfosporosinus acididurans TaxID=476652 RepID=A0A0J1FLQ4_9FIRM|nr:hypothetical protein [Desulfosporosinus acididurans]KLU64400.1 hypothetical protein DEAC_c36020 [Desulfosporosinus acididurans]